MREFSWRMLLVAALFCVIAFTVSGCGDVNNGKNTTGQKPLSGWHKLIPETSCLYADELVGEPEGPCAFNNPPGR